MFELQFRDIKEIYREYTHCVQKNSRVKPEVRKRPHHFVRRDKLIGVIWSTNEQIN